MPTTTKLVETETPLRLRLVAGTAGLERDSDALIAQMIAVANESFRKELGALSAEQMVVLEQKLRAVMAL